jgi:hypothetical protein
VLQNSGDGIYLKDGAIQNTLINNCFCQNSGYGIEVNGSDTLQNLWSRNSIYGNQRGGIAGGGGALLLPAPQLTALSGPTVAGTSIAGATVEFYAGSDAQGRLYLGRTVVGADGVFQFTYSGAWPADNITALVLDQAGNASGFSAVLVTGGSTTPTPTVTPGPGTPAPTATPTPGNAIYIPLIQS